MTDDPYLPPEPPPGQRPEQNLHQRIAAFTNDPLGFVRFAFPWGKPGTPLARERGPRPWQRSVLRDIGTRLTVARDGGPRMALRLAIAAGHGVGKSALLEWIRLWALAISGDTTTLLTIRNGRQLDTGARPEITKWFDTMICRDWFDWTEDAAANAEPGRHVLLFDEAGAIPDSAWDTAEGSLNDEDTEIIWIAAGLPTRNDGRFHDCFGGLRGRWSTWQVDGRAVPGTDKAKIGRWIAARGKDSDFVRVHIRGQFPRLDTGQFIAPALVDAAQHREVATDRREGLIVGVALAANLTVLFFRRGPDARSIPPIRLETTDPIHVVSRIAEVARRHRADAIFIEMGIGAGALERLRRLGVPDVIGVEFGAAADGDRGGARRGESFASKRAQIWGRMRAWLAEGAIPDNAELAVDLVGPRYRLNARDQILLERTDDMRRRGLASPDMADALALTFARD